MALSEATTNKIKVLLYDGKQREAETVLIEETGLSEEAARDYINRLASSLDQPQKAESTKRKKFTPYLFMILGMAAWIAAILVYVNKQDQISNSFTASAQVVKFIVSDGGGFAPVIRYEIDGQQYEYMSSVYSNPPAYELNEIIEIYVSKDNPAEIMINSFTSKWLVVMILAFFGLVLDIIGVVAFKLKGSNSGGISFFEREDDLEADFDD